MSLPLESDWALVEILKEKKHAELEAAGAKDVGFFIDNTRGEVFCRIIEWTNARLLKDKPNFAAWAAEQKFELILIENKKIVQGLGRQIAARLRIP